MEFRNFVLYILCCWILCTMSWLLKSLFFPQCSTLELAANAAFVFSPEPNQIISVRNSSDFSSIFIYNVIFQTVNKP